MRLGYKRVYPENWEDLMNSDCCPICGLERLLWPPGRHSSWKTCCPNHNAEFWKGVKIFDWSSIRLEAFKRDDYTCRECGFNGTSKELEGDHIKAIALGGDEFDLENVQTLCKKCHKCKTRRDMFKIRLKSWKSKR